MESKNLKIWESYDEFIKELDSLGDWHHKENIGKYMEVLAKLTMMYDGYTIESNANTSTNETPEPKTIYTKSYILRIFENKFFPKCPNFDDLEKIGKKDDYMTAIILLANAQDAGISLIAERRPRTSWDTCFKAVEPLTEKHYKALEQSLVDAKLIDKPKTNQK